LSYVFDHETRDLASRLTRSHHDRHDMSAASKHVHLDHVACLEVCVLRGPSGAVAAHADTLATQRGVRHAHLHVIPVQVSTALHAHSDKATEHGHFHA
jgi:CopG family nickel-responsive transcriptional regulator